MQIPDDFKSVIADTFYDKTITLYTVEEVVDEEGWARMSETESDSFVGSVSFSELAKVQEEYGLREAIDMVVSTHEDVSVGSVLGYGDHLYKVVSAIPFDSHYLILAKKWSSKSSTSISA